MSANSNSNQQQLQQKSRDADQLKITTAKDEGGDELLEMPRVCRCCCKGDMELLRIFDETTNQPTATAITTQSPQQQQQQQHQLRRRSKNSVTSKQQLHQHQQQQQQQRRQRHEEEQQKRKCDNPVDYALSGAHSNMDTVLEEMIIWMLNISHNDGLPQEICRQCKAQFIMVAKFRRRCVRVQQRLQELAQQIAQRQTPRDPQQELRKVEESQLDRKRRLEEPSTAQSDASLPKMQRRLESLPAMQVMEQSTSTTATTTTPIRISKLRAQCKRFNEPWRTKAARKQVSETASSNSPYCLTAQRPAATATATDASTSLSSTPSSSGHTSPEHLSDLSVMPCRGFPSDDNSSTTTSSSDSQSASPTKPKLKFPPKRYANNKSQIVVRRRRRLSTPVKRVKRIVRKTPEKSKDAALKQLKIIPETELSNELVQHPEEALNSKHINNNLEETPSSSTDESSAGSSSTEGDSKMTDAVNELQISKSEALSDAIEIEGETKEKTMLQEEKQSSSKVLNETSEMLKEESIETTEVRVELESIVSPVQFEELTSSTEQTTPTVPSPECEVEVSMTTTAAMDDQQKSELIVSIPLEALDDELQHKLCNAEAEEEGAAAGKENGEIDDVNNNANLEHFCQSATADSFNAAVALETKEIEAEPDGGEAAADSGGGDGVDGDMASLESLVVPETKAVEENNQVLPLPRTAASSMDFLAEFEKHCEKTLKQQAAAAPLELELEEAKQQMQVEMNDVESTLHGILNEMQDQHLYTPVCTPIDEFLTPADYAPLADSESTPPTPANATDLYEVSVVQQQQQQQQQQHQQQQSQVKEGNLFDSSSFSNELIGFQNDMPCFENIEASPESMAAQQSLQMELTQLLNDLQPPISNSSSSSQQQHQLLPENVSYDALYPAAPAATPVTTPVSPLSDTSSNKPQLIQMQPQEPLWQAQTAAAVAAAAAHQTTHLQWSTVGGLEAIKTLPAANMDNAATTTTTYYINASDLYQQSGNLTSDSYALVDNNENYIMEQQQQQHQQQHQQQQQQSQQQQSQQQQPIMILIQPEQPVASASNPQQAPLHISYPTLCNELRGYQPQQQQSEQQQQQHQRQHSAIQQQQVQNPNSNQTVLGLPGLVAPPPPRGRPPMLKCRFCQNGPRFSSSLEYSRHIIELHPAVAPFNCPHCPQSFAGRNKRNQHILSHHVVQQFHCGQCSQMFPAQRALDLHLQRFHMPLTADAGGDGVRLEEVQLQIATKEQQQHQQSQSLQAQSQLAVLEHQKSPSPSLPRRPRILCCPDCEDCTSATSHQHRKEQPYEELSNLQPPPTVLTPPSTIASLPSPQPICSTPHITLPSPEQSEPDSTTATLRQFRKRCVPTNSAVSTPTTTTAAPTMLMTAASPSPSSSPSSSTMENSATMQMSKLRGSHHCVVCDKRFTNIIALRKHQQLAHDSQTTMPWVCSICKRGYRKRTDMDNHMKSHEPKGRPYECNECWVRFPEFKQLAMHKFTVHELIKPHTCDECGKQFGTESALKTHIKFHGERGFQCEECDESFTNLKEFRKHRRTHNSELFYKCEHCPRTFLHYTSFRAHMNTHLPLGVFLNDKTTTQLPSKLEHPGNEELLPLTPLSNVHSERSVSEDCPGSVEMVGSSVAQSLEMIIEAP